jgi:hypothetical protein
MDMKTTTQANALKTTVEAAVERGFANVNQSKLLYPVAKPETKISSQWGRQTVEVTIHWQLQVEILAALEGAGLAPKMTNFGLVSWSL